MAAIMPDRWRSRSQLVSSVCHLWNPTGQIDRAGRAGRIASYQVADWITPLPPDALLARGMPGQGHVDFATVTRLVTGAGYDADIEVEIFNPASRGPSPRPASRSRADRA